MTESKCILLDIFSRELNSDNAVDDFVILYLKPVSA